MISTRAVVAAAAVGATLTGTAGALAAPDRPHQSKQSLVADAVERLGLSDAAAQARPREGLPEHHWGTGPRTRGHDCERKRERSQDGDGWQGADGWTPYAPN